jgi:hypothetical protein
MTLRGDSSHGNHKENIYRIYTEGNEEEIKYVPVKNQLNTKESSQGGNEGQTNKKSKTYRKQVTKCQK